MTTDTLTGNRRFRAKNRLFKRPLLVLQVEVLRKTFVHSDMGYGSVDAVDSTFWRGARLEDITN